MPCPDSDSRPTIAPGEPPAVLIPLSPASIPPVPRLPVRGLRKLWCDTRRSGFGRLFSAVEATDAIPDHVRLPSRAPG